ncbi:MAG: hypothetical protein JNL83_25000 [Myxococcales bacterium]|nr:hypothetical protein [Myxococcales bacterium]
MHPALQPYLDPKPVRTWRYVVAGALVGLIGSRVAIAILDHQVTRCFCDTTEDIALVTAKKYAFEAFPQWRSTAWNGPACPSSLDALLPWMNNKDTLDPWGTEYAFWCGRTGALEPVLHVTSAGPDRELGTADDLRSDP